MRKLDLMVSMMFLRHLYPFVDLILLSQKSITCSVKVSDKYFLQCRGEFKAGACLVIKHIIPGPISLGFLWVRQETATVTHLTRAVLHGQWDGYSIKVFSVQAMSDSVNFVRLGGGWLASSSALSRLTLLTPSQWQDDIAVET